MTLASTATEAEKKSRLFQLQCDELHRERAPPPQQVARWTKLAAQTVDAIKTIKGGKAVPFKSIDWVSKCGVSFPVSFLAPAMEKAVSQVNEYKWAAPEGVEVVSNAHLADGVFVAHVYVTMPESLLGARDFMNAIYQWKRALYMCTAVAGLKKVKAMDGFEMSFISGCEASLPDVWLSMAGQGGGVRVHFLPPEGWLKEQRCAPNMGNARPSVMSGVEGHDDTATPYYNQALLEHSMELQEATRLSEETVGKGGVSGVAVMLTRWAERRQLTGLSLPFFFEWLLRLLEEGAIQEKQDALAMLKAVFQSIQKTDLSSPLVCADTEASEETRSLMAASFPVCLLGGEKGWRNVAWTLTAHVWTRAQSEAAATVSILGDFHSFDTLFIDHHPIEAAADHFYRLSASPKDVSRVPSVQVDSVCEEGRVRQLARVAGQLIDRAMGERSQWMQCVMTGGGEQKWSVSAARPTSQASLLLCFRASQEWANPITTGPVANSPDAQAFRKFWGTRSQLRKFADNRICEAVAWAETASDKVPLQVLQAIVWGQIGLPADSLQWRSEMPSQLVPDKKSSDRLQAAYTQLSTALRQLPDMPLAVTNIHDAHALLRNTEPVPAAVFDLTWCAPAVACGGAASKPAECLRPRHVPSVKVHLKLEQSGKWGEDETTIAKLTQAFYVQLAKSLSAAHSDWFALPTRDECYVIVDEAVFRLVIIHEKTVIVARKTEEKVRDDASKTRAEVARAAEKVADVERRLIDEPLVMQSLHSVSTQHAAFPAAAQAFKRWLGARLLSDQLHELAVEMIVAAAFEQPPTTGAPLSALAALRRVLQLVVSHNWATRPLLVRMGAGWSDLDVSRLEASFVKMRPVLPAMVIICQHDLTGNKWTRDSPCPLVLKRLVACAHSTLSLLDRHINGDAPLDIEHAILCEDVSAYDVVLHVDKESAVRGRVWSEWGQSARGKALPVVDWDPVGSLMKELNGQLGDAALFFHNVYSGQEAGDAGRRIGVKFRPEPENGVPAKISRCGLHCKPSRDAMRVNKAEVLEEIAILGEGIIERIEILRK